MMSLTFGLFTQVSGSGPLGPLVLLKAKQLLISLIFITGCYKKLSTFEKMTKTFLCAHSSLIHHKYTTQNI